MTRWRGAVANAVTVVAMTVAALACVTAACTSDGEHSPARAVCDRCGTDDDCAEIPDGGFEGYSCVLEVCCANPGPPCTAEEVQRQCPR